MLKITGIDLKNCLFGQTTKQYCEAQIENKEIWKQKQLWGCEPDLSYL